MFESILFQRFLDEMLLNIRDEIHDLASEKNNVTSVESMQCVEPLRLRTDKFKQKVIGAIFVNCINAMHNQHQYQKCFYVTCLVDIELHTTLFQLQYA